MKYILLALMFVTTIASAVTDEGTISELYAANSGHVAIKLSDGFPDTRSVCPNNNGWAGVTVDAPELKSALLAAKMSQSTVVVSISGCTANGAWMNIDSVYVK